jgi:hypothetical protein
MSSNYSVSTSESSSFCTNPALHHTQFGHAPSDAATRGGRRAEGAAAAASPTRDDVTPKKASQSSKSATAAATAQESPSMTIRSLPIDYSKRMEDQKARSSALERYKMLVKANRLVPSDNEASPDPKQTKGRVEQERDVSTTWRRSEQVLSIIRRDASVASNTVLSDVSDGERDDGAAAGGTAGRKSANRNGADPQPPRSVSRRQPQSQQQRERSSSSPVSVSVSVERPAYPNSVKQQREAKEEVVVPKIDLTKTLAHQPAQQQQQQQSQPLSSTVPPSANRSTAARHDDDDDAAMDYVPPELTQPFGNSNLKPRRSLRPGYEPVTEHRSSSLTRTSSFTGEGQRTPRKQSGPSSQGRSHSCAAQGRQSASPNGCPSTPRRKSTTRARAVAALPPADATPPVEQTEGLTETTHVDAAAAEPPAGDAEARQDGVVPLPGSKTAFWLRPSSAMYEMTTSIAAKRKDHVELESATTRTSSRRGSHSFHAIPSGSSSSLCGTPRGRNAPAAAAAASATEEEKPRFSAHMSAADRKLYEKGGAAIKPPPVSTYDAIFSNRQSTVQHSSTRRSQKMKGVSTAAAPANATTSSTASSTPRGTPRGTSQRRAGSRADKAHSLNSNPLVHTPTEEETGRVSTRQQDALSKHCARVAAGGGAAVRTEEPATAPSAALKGSKAKKGGNVAAAGTAAALKAATAAAPANPPVKRPAALTPAEPGVHKKLEYDATEEGDEEPVPQMVVPNSSKRFTAPYHDGCHATGVAGAEEDNNNNESSPHTTIHGRRAGEDATPSKSRRRENDTTASPPRNDDNNNDSSSGGVDARFAAQEAAMAREKEAARAQQAREALESCRLARQARMEAARTSHSAVTAVSTNEVVAAMLQGIVQQTRQVLPCYMCGELQCTSGYRVHVSACRPKTEAVLVEYFTTIVGLSGIPAETRERIERLAAQEVPQSTSDVSVRDAFAKECYQCVKGTLVPCRKCGTHLRIQDVKEHEMLCGRAYYQNSRAAERVRSAVDRIERGSQE